VRLIKNLFNGLASIVTSGCSVTGRIILPIGKHNFATGPRTCPSFAIVSLRCTPVAGESQPRSSSAAVSLEMDVVENRIANLEELNHNPDAAAVARAVSSEMTQSHWNRLRRLCLGAKRRYTETTESLNPH